MMMTEDMTGYDPMLIAPQGQQQQQGHLTQQQHHSLFHHHHQQQQHQHNHHQQQLMMPHKTQHGAHLDSDTSASMMSDDELAGLNIKDLNRKLKEKGLPKQVIEKLKQRRRTLKNRKYATDCREKKDSEVQNLEGDKDNEFKELTPLESENAKLRREIDNMKEKYQRMREFARRNNISIKDHKVSMKLHAQSLHRQ